MSPCDHPDHVSAADDLAAQRAAQRRLLVALDHNPDRAIVHMRAGEVVEYRPQLRPHRHPLPEPAGRLVRVARKSGRASRRRVASRDGPRRPDDPEPELEAARVCAASGALRHLRDLEAALDVVAAAEPRDELCAAVVWLAYERLRRHHLEPHRAIIEEHGFTMARAA